MGFDDFAVHVNTLFVKPEDLVGKLLHAAVGISGEIAEIQECLNRFDEGEGMDWENLLEECGDTLFYVQALCLCTGAKMCDLMPVGVETDDLHQTCRTAVVASGKILDAIKKVWVYRRKTDLRTLDDSIAVLLRCIVEFINYASATIPQVMQWNYEKLKVRYPDGYTDAAAQARADKAGCVNE